jgi:hypothetical protein
MRSIGLSLLVCGFVAAALGLGCGGKQPETLDPRDAMQGEFAGAPDWVIRGCSSYWGDDASENICGVGSAGGSRNISLMRTTAIGRGRTEIARTLQTKVKAMLKDYASTTTGGEDFGTAANDEQHIVDVTKQITDISLSGTEMTDSWISQNGTFYALVALDLEKFEDSVRRMDQLSESVRKAVVERAEQSFAELDDEIEKERAR